MSISKYPHSPTKISNANPRSLFSITDVNRLYRKQQTYRKKLKLITQTNLMLESRIKVFESTIKDQRSTILFQLNELSKTMNSKISTYVDEKLDKDRFKDNQQAQQTIKQMINKFQGVEKQTKATKKVYLNLDSIYQRYQQYSQQIDSLVKMTYKSNKQYQDSMKNMLHQKQSQIFSKRQANQDTYDSTQSLIKKIDQFQSQKLKLIQQQSQLVKYVQKLKKIQNQTKQQVNKFTSWADIAIDKNHRKLFNKQSKSKNEELELLRENNRRLQVYMKQLQNQEEMFRSKLAEKENQLAAVDKEKVNNIAKGKKNKHPSAR